MEGVGESRGCLGGFPGGAAFKTDLLQRQTEVCLGEGGSGQDSQGAQKSVEGKQPCDPMRACIWTVFLLPAGGHRGGFALCKTCPTRCVCGGVGKRK